MPRGKVGFRGFALEAGLTGTPRALAVPAPQRILTPMASSANRDASLLPGHNLGCRGQTLRLRAAVVLVAVGLGAAIAFVKGDFPTWARALCFVPFVFAANLAFQGLFRTCPMHAKKHTREDDEGHVDRVIGDRDRRGARRLSAMVIGWSLGVASAATGLLFLLP